MKEKKIKMFIESLQKNVIETWYGFVSTSLSERNEFLPEKINFENYFLQTYVYFLLPIKLFNLSVLITILKKIFIEIPHHITLHHITSH